MSAKTVMIYGASGFTAHLILERIKDVDLNVVLGGRSQEKMMQLSRKHEYPTRIFSLEDENEVAKNLDGIDLVVNCAGPFIFTAEPLAIGALRCGCDYFDINGEVDVFYKLFKFRHVAEARQVSLLPGLGFDIAPSDCLAARLAKDINHPASLLLVIWPKGTRPTHGTLKSAFFRSQRKFNLKGQESGLEGVPKISKFIDLEIKGEIVKCIRAPLADLLTSRVSTGIKDIRTYLVLSQELGSAARIAHYFTPLGKIGFIKNRILRAIESRPSGPSKKQQQSGSALIYAEVKDEDDQSLRAIMHTPEPYVYTSQLIINGIREWQRNGLKGGFLTPSQAFGAGFAEQTCPESVKIEYLKGQM